jgi:hypothetical protein
MYGPLYQGFSAKNKEPLDSIEYGSSEDSDVNVAFELFFFFFEVLLELPFS